MDSTNDKRFAFLPCMDDAILINFTPEQLRFGLDFCSSECIHMYRCLYRIGNGIRKYFFAALLV